jgi:hypothetical protein
MQVAQKVVGAALLVGASLLAVSSSGLPRPSPMPAPTELSLRGAFVGETATADALGASAMWSEVADAIEWDGQQSEPMFKTGHSLDTFRSRARDLRWQGQRVGDRQPQARKLAHEYLDKKIGIDGGDLTPEIRSRWVSAYRELGRAAADAAR